MAILTAPRINGRFSQLLLLAAILLILTIVFYANADAIHIPESISLKPPTKGRPHHPIDDLIEEADRQQDALLQKESHALADAVRAYEHRRGRRPPPGFDAWFHFAQENNALVIEDFFDRVYHDLNPFWAVPALTIRQQAGDIFHRISIRNGNTSQLSDQPRVWLDLWENLIGTIVHHLPDLDIPINVMDESRVVVPWETIDEYMTAEQKSRRIVPASEVITKFGQTSVGKDEEVPQFDPQWEGGPYWDRAVIGCHPDSPARSYKAEEDYTVFPPLNNSYPEKSHEGYVANWTYVKQPCEHPQLQGLHGTFVEPISISNSRKLMPLFGGSKLPMNNEILLPPAMYWTDDPFYSGGEEHGAEWDKKKNKIIWRGAASGGRNKDTTWARFQRHRFVSMVNSTSVAHAEETGKQPNFELPQSGQYDLPSGSLAKWVGEWGDAAFVHLLCFPDTRPPFCDYDDAFYMVKPSMPMGEQYDYKYLPDIDGNSFSGRYRGFLGSTSLPIKATIYDEWHDSRMMPWKHFVPMDNTFVDIYGIMHYFLGGRDTAAKKIALEGKEWTETVLRREDMQIYVFRLLLEYGRLCDDNREKLGWVSEAERLLLSGLEAAGER
jgi:hypothetical protein